MTYDFPADLVDLYRDYEAAERRSAEVAASHPPASDIVAGEAEVSEEQRAELNNARAQVLALVLRIDQHAWWGTVADRADARAALKAMVAAETKGRVRPAAEEDS